MVAPRTSDSARKKLRIPSRAKMSRSEVISSMRYTGLGVHKISKSWHRRRWPSDKSLIFQEKFTWRTSRRCWQRLVLVTDSPSSSPSARFMKKFVRHQSPQYITFCATPGSLKQSLPKIFAKPRGIMRLPPRIDITVDLQAPLAPTTRMRAPRPKLNVTSFSTLGKPAAYAYERPVTSRTGPSTAGIASSRRSSSLAVGASYSWKTHPRMRVYKGTRAPCETRVWYSTRSDILQHFTILACEKKTMCVAQSASESKMCVA
mmetsp:Transcript_95863/g.293208  ORF Transcript_95863/g.293208 Transcript_95863/m.293208 type:complete len:260 (-) Transcript_95863:677-1456(-)